MDSLSLNSHLIYINAPPNSRSQTRFACSVVAGTPSSLNAVVRRSGNYKPSIWDHHYLLSLENVHAKDKRVGERAESLKESVRKTLHETEGPLRQLELIDNLQRLGISYHFMPEIHNILAEIYDKNTKNSRHYRKEEDLHTRALGFRLLRDHGFHVTQDVFGDLEDEEKMKTYQEDTDVDVKGLLSTYEASYLSTGSDTRLMKIGSEAAERLRESIVTADNGDGTKSYVSETVARALNMPYHWRARRFEARWYIDVYGMKHDMDPVLLELAKIDFNMVQATHQEEVKYISSWWNNSGLKQLHFARDRAMESYLWTVGLLSEPEFGYYRQIFAKIIVLITTIDDIFDVYGTIEELVAFTKATESWDVHCLEELPEYMRLCFLVMYNETNQIGQDVLRAKNFNVIPYLKKSWADLVKAYLTEAKWYKNGYKPSLREYMQNAIISISTPTILLQSFCVLSDQISKETLDTLSEHPQPLVRCCATVFRFADDLGTSTDELARGDVPKSIQCYMHETGASEAEARAHVKQMIRDTWEEINRERTARGSTSLPRRFIEVAMNLARMSLCMYQYGDGHGCPDKANTVDRIRSLLIDPIPLD
ncbi:PREDICTED: 1,8-cineole synthase 1, chloroplastic-like isoform X2 [Tarenaya hassleriana]|uniref:1,8-cineole synthase 1, chloroplastic-like isoform X2 n=1 Tax=Tarenaya hassleriana TaxID=28532 RepID=UPI00053C38DD|nr:PREDICTED: 1,8-cineole synthase 1, chloroplastic-like isoform X2 [Tarenaya hassleriana]